MYVWKMKSDYAVDTYEKLTVCFDIILKWHLYVMQYVKN